MKGKLKRFLKKTYKVRLFLLLLIFIVFFYIYLSRPFFLVMVFGDSMYPTFKNHQFLYFSKDITQLHNNDVIVFKYDNEVYIKRIIGSPGDTYVVNILDPVTYYILNNKNDGYNTPLLKFLTIPANQYFVEGDNINISIDSRTYGLISKTEILGKYSIVYNNK